MSPLIRFLAIILTISFNCPNIPVRANSSGHLGIQQDESKQMCTRLRTPFGGGGNISVDGNMLTITIHNRYGRDRIAGMDNVVLDEIRIVEENIIIEHPGGQDAAPPIPVPYPQAALYLDLVSKVPITGDPIKPKNIRISGRSVSILPSGTVDISYPDSPEMRLKIYQEIRRILVEDMTARLQRGFGSTADRQSAARLYADISVALATSGVDYGKSGAGSTNWNYHYKIALEQMPQRNFAAYCADRLAGTFAFALEAMTKMR